MSRSDETQPSDPKFDFSAYPDDTCFHERRSGRDRRQDQAEAEAKAQAQTEKPEPERRTKKERRRRIDPTTFEKQYTDEELEFMNAMQRYKVLSGKTFPSYGEVLDVAYALGYRRPGETELEPIVPVPEAEER